LSMNPRATMVLVIVVPTLAPMMMGIALSSEIDWDATSATAIEVVVELLCTIAVARTPMRKLVKGFEVATIIDSVAMGLRFLSAEVIRSIEYKNNNSTPVMYNPLRNARCRLMST
jgi:hypothetical protein